MSRASCHSAGLKAELEMGGIFSFLPVISTLIFAVGPGQDAPESQCGSCEGFPWKQPTCALLPLSSH